MASFECSQRVSFASQLFNKGDRNESFDGFLCHNHDSVHPGEPHWLQQREPPTRLGKRPGRVHDQPACADHGRYQGHQQA